MSSTSPSTGSAHLKFICVLLAAAVLAGGVLLALSRMEDADRVMREELGRQARLIAETVRPDILSALSGTGEDLSLPEYLRLKGQLGAVLAAFPDVGRLSLVGRQPGGPLFLLVNSEPGQGDLPGSACAWADPGPDAAEAVSFEEGGRIVSWYPIVTPETGKGGTYLVLEAAGENWKNDIRREGVLPAAGGIILSASIFGAYAVLTARTRLRYARAGIVLLTGLLLTGFLARLAHERDIFDRGKAFSAIADARSGKLNILFDTVQDLALTSLVWYMESSEEVLEDEFEHFTGPLVSLPEVDSAAWIPASGVGAFPQPGEGDLKAMELAALTGLPTSSNVRTRPGPDGPWKELRVFKSARERRDERKFMGLASFALRLDAFLTKAVRGGERDLIMRLWELGEGGPAAVSGPFTPDLPGSFSGMAISPDMPLYSVRPVFAFGRTFAAEMLPGPDFLLHHPLRRGLSTLAMGFLISVSAASAVGAALRHGDILERKVQKRTAELVDSMDRLQLADQIFRSTTEGIVITDSEGFIEDGNLALEQLTGYALEELRGKKPGMFGVQRISPDSSGSFWDQLREAGVWQGEVINRRKTGEVYPVWLTVTAVRDREGRITHFAGVLTHIGDIKAEQERLSHLAYHDPLTGLPNRYLLMDRLEMAIARARRAGALAAAVFIDLDGFKAVNDTWGHETGDFLLVSVAERLTKAVREQDTVARPGGDEFIAVLDGFSSPGEIDTLLNRINGAFSEPVKAGDRLIAISASVGAAVYPDDGETANELIAKADEYMYAHKSRNRGASR